MTDADEHPADALAKMIGPAGAVIAEPCGGGRSQPDSPHGSFRMRVATTAELAAMRAESSWLKIGARVTLPPEFRPAGRVYTVGNIRLSDAYASGIAVALRCPENRTAKVVDSSLIRKAP